MKKLLLIMLFVMVSLFSFSQNSNRDTIIVRAILYENELISIRELTPIIIVAQLTKDQKKKISEYKRIRNAVYITYPYARTAGMLLNDINDNLSKIDGRKNRKTYLHSREDEVRKKFTRPIKNLSVYQGKVLMKLINRETGNDCYDIVKEYKGGFVAGSYQTILFFFNSNLKQDYDPSDDDKLIEKFVKEVQSVYGYDEISKNHNL